MALITLVLLPLLGGLALVAGGRGLAAPVATRVGAALAVVTFLLAVVVAVTRPVVDRSWLPELGVRAHLGIDGISVPLILLTALVGTWSAISATVRLAVWPPRLPPTPSATKNRPRPGSASKLSSFAWRFRPLSVICPTVLLSIVHWKQAVSNELSIALNLQPSFDQLLPTVGSLLLLLLTKLFLWEIAISIPNIKKLVINDQPP